MRVLVVFFFFIKTHNNSKQDDYFLAACQLQLVSSIQKNKLRGCKNKFYTTSHEIFYMKSLVKKLQKKGWICLQSLIMDLF